MDVEIETQHLSLWYGEKQALKNVSIKIPEEKVTAIIGPSGCGKSTLIRCFNRMNDIIENCRVEGKIFIDENDIYDRNVDVVDLRKNVGMVFQKPNPFPKNIYENIAYAPRIHGIKNKKKLDDIVKKGLKEAFLWDEVKDRLHESAMGLSGGQQQRLCIARAKIEELIRYLSKEYTVVIVTHNMQQASRVSDYTAYMYIGKLIEFGTTRQIFENPREENTENYITGRFG